MLGKLNELVKKWIIEISKEKVGVVGGCGHTLIKTHNRFACRDEVFIACKTI